MKLCLKCNTEKSLDNFSKRNKEKGTYQAWCKVCLRDHNRKTYKESSRRRNQVRAAANRYRAALEEFLFTYLREHPCVSCGETNILVLQFDHLHNKKFNISENLKSSSIDPIKSEVDKCQVLCANCHSIKTAKDSNNWKLKWLNKESVV